MWVKLTALKYLREFKKFRQRSQFISHEMWVEWTDFEYLRRFKEFGKRFRGVYATKKVSIIEYICKINYNTWYNINKIMYNSIKKKKATGWCGRYVNLINEKKYVIG